MARVVTFSELGGPDVLKIEDVEVPPPGSGEVQIAVKAIGLTLADVNFRKGVYFESPQLPARLGYEAAGIIAAIGPDVCGLEVGDEVSVIPSFSLNSYGMYGDLVNAPAYAVVRHPSWLSFEEAASIWMQFLTPWGALIDIAKIGKHDVIVIGEASSSIGLGAIQIANEVGATPIALTRQSNKREALLNAGAAYVIATEEQDLISELRQITDGNGVSVVFDPVAGEDFVKLVEATSRRGIIFIYDAFHKTSTPLPVNGISSKGITVRGYTMLEVVQDPRRLKRALNFIVKGLAKDSLTPTIAKTFALEQIVEAHSVLELQQEVGKLVVRP